MLIPRCIQSKTVKVGPVGPFVILASVIWLILYQYYQVQKVSEVNGANVLEKLSAEVRMRILRRQNPESCDKARLLVYHVSWWPCGFGCTTHVTLQHFLLAFFTNRTFVFVSNGWSYDREGWDHYFMPLGNCTYDGIVKSLPAFSDETSNVRIVRNSNRFLAFKYDWKIPRNILTKLKDLHSDPYAWWIGQFINYMLRFQPWFAEVLESKSKIVSLPRKAVGLQIRWGDKTAVEAAKHPASEYMGFVKKWFEQPEHRGLNKTVYVATEQSQAWKDLTDNYHEFSFIGAGYVNRNKELEYRKGSRYGQRKNELEAILTDIYFLSKCSYIVCTLSSNICRLLYELRSTKTTEPQAVIQSLDAKFYWLMSPLKLQAVEDHVAHSGEDGMDMRKGDIFITPDGPFRTRVHGCVPVINAITGLEGPVPMKKLKGIMQPVEFDG